MHAWMCAVFSCFFFAFASAFSFAYSYVSLVFVAIFFSIFVCLSQRHRIRCLVFAIIVALRCLLLLLSLLLIPHLLGDFFRCCCCSAYSFLCVCRCFYCCLPFSLTFLFTLFLTTATIALDRYDLLLCYCSRRLYYTNTQIVCLSPFENIERREEKKRRKKQPAPMR